MLAFSRRRVSSKHTWAFTLSPPISCSLVDRNLCIICTVCVILEAFGQSSHRGVVDGFIFQGCTDINQRGDNGHPDYPLFSGYFSFAAHLRDFCISWFRFISFEIIYERKSLSKCHNNCHKPQLSIFQCSIYLNLISCSLFIQPLRWNLQLVSW